MMTRRRMLMVPPAAAVAAAVPAGGRDARAWPRPAPFEPVREPVRGPWIRAPYDTYVRNPLVARNTFSQMTPDAAALPSFAEASRLLPEPFWDGHAPAIACAAKAWKLAFANLRRPEAASGFVARFIDPAFNDCVFLWDSCFMTLFRTVRGAGVSAVRCEALDNFYAKQHPDGFICREIGRALGDDRFPRFDPSSTGPNVLAWAEWEHYRNFGDGDWPAGARVSRSSAPTTSGCAPIGPGRTAPPGRRVGGPAWTTSPACPPARRTPIRSATTGT